MKTKNIKKEYKKSFNFIKESQKYIYVIIFIFILFSLIGFFTQPDPELKQKILEFVKKLLEKTNGMSQIELIIFIFLNNLQSTFTSLIGGIAFGILPFLASISNGYLVGYIGKIAVEKQGISALLKLFPHGIFELPAVFISLGLGLKISSFIFQKQKIKSLKEYLTKSLKIFLLIVLPLLIIAAIIEGTLIYLFS